MAEKSFPLENTVYTAEDASLWFATRTSGVHASDQLGVTAADGLAVNVGAGIAWLKYADFAGVAYANTEPKMLLIGAANANYPRIDRVVIRYSRSENRVYLAVKSGNAANSPAAPDVTRNADTYEISLAQVRVNAKATSISASDITDERLNNAVCGLMTDGVTDFILDSLLITTDPTLTIEGAAADSKAVGDRFGNMLAFVQGRAPKVHAENHRFTDTLTWDGEIGDRETVTEELADGVVCTYVRVWDEAVPLDNGFSADAFFDNPGLEAYYSLGYRYERFNEQISVVIDELGHEFLGMYTGYPTIWCISSDNTEWGDMVFPKAGVYFTTATAQWGIPYRTKSLTVYNYDFGDAADPIAPEMISAAPECHASESEKYGVATNKRFGHARVFYYDDVPYLGTEDKGQNTDWYYNQTDGLIGDAPTMTEYARGAALGVGFFALYNVIMGMEMEDKEALWEQLDDLYRRVRELENKVNALGG